MSVVSKMGAFLKRARGTAPKSAINTNKRTPWSSARVNISQQVKGAELAYGIKRRAGTSGSAAAETFKRGGRKYMGAGRWVGRTLHKIFSPIGHGISVGGSKLRIGAVSSVIDRGLRSKGMLYTAIGGAFITGGLYGAGRSFTEQRTRTQRGMVGPSATQYGQGFVAWSKGRGQGMPSNHLGHTGLTLALHKQRHR